MKPGDRLLIASGYAIGALLWLVPLLDMSIAMLPTRPSDLQWRFGLFGLMGNSVLLPLLGTLIMSLTAYHLGNRKTSLTIAVLSGTAAVAALLAAGFLALDALQLRAMVRPEMRRSFMLAAAKSTLTLGVGSLIWVWLTVGAFRAGRTDRTGRSGQERKAGTVLSRGEKTERVRSS